jgi:hypothetical protein
MLPLFALMIIIGAFFFAGTVTAYAADDLLTAAEETLTIDDVWLTGDTLHVTVTDKSAGVTRFIELPLSGYATEADELVTVQVTDGHGRVSNAVCFENPYYDVQTSAPEDITVEETEYDPVAALIEEAEKYIGYPYVWGGSTPETSFDCSGLVCWALNQSGAASVERTTAQGLYDLCTPVSPDDARPGDLIFFTKTYRTTDTVTHVGIYLGDNIMINAGDPIKYERTDSPNRVSHFYAFGRISSE